MRTLRYATALLLAATASVSFAQTARDPAASAIKPETVKAHVTFLADDLLQGRDTGTAGYDIAARYVATQFEMLGLKPAVNGDWYQQVRFRSTRPMAATPPAMTIGGTSFASGQDLVVQLPAGAAVTRAPADAVFVGHGIVSPKHNIDDYAGLDVKGKTVVMFVGMPASIPAADRPSVQQGRAMGAMARGATGVVLLFDASITKQYPWTMIRDQIGGEGIELATAGEEGPAPQMPVTYIGGEGAGKALFAGAARDYASVLAAADKGETIKGFALAQKVGVTGGTERREFDSPNVIGMIPGSDPALKGEAVLLMAHLDHVGVKPGTEGDDKIFNGAMDNAAGVASMLEVARAFQMSGKAPRRTILFAAVTGEEHGLLGSQHLAKNHVIDGQRVVSVVNLDMPVLLYDFTDVVAFGAEHSTMGPVVAKAAATEGVKLSPDPMPEENLFMRSDHYSFVQAGVPSVFLVTGFANGGEKVFRDFLATHYHKPSDQVDLPFNWGAAAKFARVNYAIAREMADTNEAPRWYGDSPFAKTAPGRPTATRPASAN